MTPATLTPTEDLICRYKLQGLQVKEISYIMEREISTIKTHFRNIHAKLKINNEVELVLWYIKNVLEINVEKSDQK